MVIEPWPITSDSMNKDAKIFVAGHRGMVGSAICRALAADGFSNVITRTHAELDLLDQRAVGEFLKQQQADCVLIAAVSHGFCAGFSSKKEAKRFNKYRLPSPSFASDDIETVRKLNRQTVDDCQTLNVQLGKQERGPLEQCCSDDAVNPCIRASDIGLCA